MPAGNDTRGVGQHINLIDSFSPRVGLPIDDRLFINDISTINTDIPEYIRYDGLIVYSLNQDTYFCYTNNEWRIICVRYGYGDTDPALDGTDSSFLNQDVFINNTSGEMFRKVIQQDDTSVDPLTIAWKTDVNFTGPQGEQGMKGDRGVRGSRWTAGTSITGTSADSTVYPSSGINDALINDQYLNTDTGDTYQCTADGDPSTAEWIYTGNIKGLKGDKGDPGQKGDMGEQGLEGPQGIPGSRFYSGVSIVGPTTNPIAFPNATDIENIDIAMQDYYLNQDTGHLYVATTSGKGNAVLWQRNMLFKGSVLYTGTGMNHTGTATFETGNIAYSNINDVYINLNTGMVYRCTTEGDKTTALWTAESTIASIPQVFSPASDKEDGTPGLVPAPTSGASNRFLSSDGTWKEVDLSSSIPTTGGDFTGPVTAPEITVNNSITVGSVAITEEMATILKELSDNNLDITALLNRISTLETNYTNLSNTVNTMNTTLTSTTNTANTALTNANSAKSITDKYATMLNIIGNGQ